ncbi:MAG: hypothetical protein LBT89_00985 [Planctomycetaceae bacterium]|jgi:hypothetical protein|nr:hypothetical protein [Planctomycetaceae bacterium]
MSSLVEKLAAVENEIIAAMPKMESLVNETDTFTQKLAAFAGQSSDIAEKAAVLRKEAADTQQCLRHIQTLITEVKADTEAFVASQENNQQRCETMTAVFGEAFQTVSRFFETAQRLGLAQSTSLPPALESEPVEVPKPAAKIPEPAVVEPEPVAEIPEPVIVEPEPVEEISEPVIVEPEPAVEEPEPVAEIPAAPPLPDITAAPEDVSAETNDVSDIPDDMTENLTGNLDVPPLNFGNVPPPINADGNEDGSDEQDIENMLADMMKPVTA